MTTNCQIVNMKFLELKVVKMPINRQNDDKSSKITINRQNDDESSNRHYDIFGTQNR